MGVSGWELLWNAYSHIVASLTPIGAFLGGAILAWTAIRQAWSATQQAKIARLRHEEQIKADYERRITEIFTKALEQLASDKIDARLGGIYSLERVSQESPPQYWIVMEIITAFIRERARWKESKQPWRASAKEKAENTESEYDLPTDISAAIAVIARRDEKNRARENAENWYLDLRGSDLRGAFLRRAHLEGAFLIRAHLEGAQLVETHLESACLMGAYLRGASLMGARLEGAILEEARLEGGATNLRGAHLEGSHLAAAHLEGTRLRGAHLERAGLQGAHLEKAFLVGAHLDEANLQGTHLEGTDLSKTLGITRNQLSVACGDENTVLPQGMTRPPQWSSRTEERAS